MRLAIPARPATLMLLTTMCVQTAPMAAGPHQTRASRTGGEVSTIALIAERCLGGDVDTCLQLRGLWSWEANLPFAATVLAWLAVPGYLQNVRNEFDREALGSMQAGAAFTLGMMREQSAVKVLSLIASKHDIAQVRDAASTALRRIADPTAAVRPPARSSSGRETLAPVTDADRARVPELIVLIRNPATRSFKTFEELGRIGDPAAVEPLIAALSDTRWHYAITLALGKIGDPRAFVPLMTVLSSGVELDRNTAIDTLRKFTVKPVDRLLAALSDSNPRTRAGAAAVLRNAPPSPEVVDALMKALQDRELEVRRQAASALGPAGDERAVPLLIAGLRDADAIVQFWSAHSLGERVDPRAADPLREYLTVVRKRLGTARSDLERSIVLSDISLVEEALAKSGGRPAASSRETLMADLRSADDGTRLAAAVALAERGDAAAIEPLLGFLRHREPGTRRSAAEALALTKVGFMALTQELSRRDRSVETEIARHAVIAAIGRVLHCAWPEPAESCRDFRPRYTLPLEGLF